MESLCLAAGTAKSSSGRSTRGAACERSKGTRRRCARSSSTASASSLRRGTRPCAFGTRRRRRSASPRSQATPAPWWVSPRTRGESSLAPTTAPSKSGVLSARGIRHASAPSKRTKAACSASAWIGGASTQGAKTARSK
eukprot:Amastigsp_a845055_8.p2 type:complete len:139 gc:universal Amastigsp_a845055_8:460-44(-)